MRNTFNFMLVSITQTVCVCVRMKGVEKGTSKENETLALESYNT